MNILFATDGSDCSAMAGRLLRGLPLPDNTLVRVMSAIPESGWIDLPVSSDEGTAALRVAEAAAASLRERGVRVAVNIRYQSPAEAILEQAEADRAEFILVGSHGKGAVQRFLLGSVSERVARCAHCSVLVARGDTLRRAIIAVDGSESAERALEAAAMLPLPSEMELRVVHVIQPSDREPPLPLGPSPTEDTMIEAYDDEHLSAGDRILRHAVTRLHRAGREATPERRIGAPAEELVAAARAFAADLVVVGAANRSALGRLFLGSVSGRVLTHAPCSVLVARPSGAPGR